MKTKILGLLAVGLLAWPMAASAAVITVNTASLDSTAGDSSCSLSEAISNANLNGDASSFDCAAGSGNDVIGFFIDDFSIDLLSALDIQDNLIIQGPVTIFGPNGIDLIQAFVVDQGVTLTLLEVTDGSTGCVIGGGCTGGNTGSVPEPGTLALLGLGLAGLGLSRRRRAA